MNINIRSFLVVAVVIVIIIIGAYIFLEKIGGKTENNKDDSNKKGDESYLIPGIPTVLELTEVKEELKINTKPKLNVGEKWVYNVVMRVVRNDNKTAGQTENIIIDVIYYIEGIERINKSDCYVITVKTYNLLQPELNVLIPKYIIYLSKDTGELIKLTIEHVMEDESGRLIPRQIDIDKKLAEAMLSSGFMIGDFMLQPWMLALSKDFKWKVYANTTIDEKHIEEIFEYIVEGVETVNERECFKVNFRAFNVKENRVTVRKTIWVDVDKRVVVKAKTIIGDLEVAETNLKDITHI